MHRDELTEQIRRPLRGFPGPRSLLTGCDRTYTYDGLGNRVSLSSPDTGLTTYEYDPAGNVRGTTDARGVTQHTHTIHWVDLPLPDLEREARMSFWSNMFTTKGAAGSGI